MCRESGNTNTVYSLTNVSRRTPVPIDSFEARLHRGYVLTRGVASYIRIDILETMKPVRFLGDSLKCLRGFPVDARQDAGRQLDLIQRGRQPNDFKPMPTIGKGVEEIRIWDDMGTFRVIYTARLVDAVYVLHAFQKKTRTTSKRDIATAKARFAQLTRG